MYFSVLHRIPRKTLNNFHVSSLRELVKDSGGLSFLWQLSGKRNNNVLPGKNCFLIDLAFGRKDQITKLQLWKTLVISFLKILARLCSQHYIKQTQVYCNFLCSCFGQLNCLHSYAFNFALPQNCGTQFTHLHAILRPSLTCNPGWVLTSFRD